MSDDSLKLDLRPRYLSSESSKPVKGPENKKANKKPKKVNLEHLPVKPGTDFWQNRRAEGRLTYLYFQRRDEVKLNVALYKKTASGFEFGQGLEIGYLSKPSLPSELKEGMEKSLGFFAGEALKLGASLNVNFSGLRASGWKSYILNGWGFSVSIGGVPSATFYSRIADTHYPAVPYIKPLYYIDFSFYQNLLALPLFGQHLLKLDAVLGASVMLSANFNLREAAPSLGLSLSYSFLLEKYLAAIEPPSLNLNVRAGMNFYARGIFPQLTVGASLGRGSFSPEAGLAVFYLPQNTGDNPYKMILGDASYNKIQEVSRRSILVPSSIEGSINNFNQAVADISSAFSQVSPSIGAQSLLGEKIFHHNLGLGLYSKIAWRRTPSKNTFVLLPEVSLLLAGGGVFSSSRPLTENGAIEMEDLTRPQIFLTGQLGADIFGINFGKKHNFRFGIQTGIFSLWTLYGIPYTVFPYLGFNFGGNFSL